MSDIQESMLWRRMRTTGLHWRVTSAGTYLLRIEDLQVERRKITRLLDKDVVVTHAGTTLLGIDSSGNLTQDWREILRELL